jgi:HD-GYP domain-containing protein (c-di-GMP phosphodiesterase class II)
MGTFSRISFWLEDLRQTNLRLDIDSLLAIACENISLTARELLKPDEFAELETEIGMLRRFANSTPAAEAEVLKAKEAAADLLSKHFAGRPELFERARRVSETALAIGAQLRLAEFERQVLEIGGLLYDIGKTCLDCELLNTTGPLDAAQWERLQAHTTLGESLIKESPALAAMNIHAIARSHHERFEGNGYPDMLVTRAIPLAARIIGVADAYHAMLSDRPHAWADPLDKVIETFRNDGGKQWDPIVTEALLELVDVNAVPNVVRFPRRAAL